MKTQLKVSKGKECYRIRDNENRIIANIEYGGQEKICKAEASSYAFLMAAAPELLEAFKSYKLASLIKQLKGRKNKKYKKCFLQFEILAIRATALAEGRVG